MVPDREQTAAWRRARRDVARLHHPDRGGDAATYWAVLAEVDRRFGVAPSPSPCAVAPVTRGRATYRSRGRRLVRALRRAARSGRARLPRWVPGARRWVDL